MQPTKNSSPPRNASDSLATYFYYKFHKRLSLPGRWTRWHHWSQCLTQRAWQMFTPVVAAGRPWLLERLNVAAVARSLPSTVCLHRSAVLTRHISLCTRVVPRLHLATSKKVSFIVSTAPSLSYLTVKIFCSLLPENWWLLISIK